MRQRIVNTAARPEFWLLGLLLWLLLSASRSLGTPWARVALTEALRWSAGIGLALTLGLLFQHIKDAMRFVVLLVGILALLGIAGGFQPEHGGLTGPYQEHQLYGSVLLILLPSVLAVVLTARDQCWRLGAGAAASLGALCLFLSQTRSAWIGAVAAALVFGGLWLFRMGRRHDRRSVCLTATALAGAALSVWLLTAPTNLSAPLTTRVGTFSSLGNDPSWQERLKLWQGAARLVATHPLCGIGLGRYPGAQWDWTRSGSPLKPTDHPTLSEEAHDFYLQTAAEIGLIGLSLYGAVLAAFVCQGLRHLRQTHRPRSASREALVIASLSLVAGQVVDAVASPSWQFAEASFFFWALLGTGLAALRHETSHAIPIHFSPILHRAGRFALAGGLAIILAANLLPIGLLTPVEAYTHTSSVSFQKVTIAQTTANCPTGSACFSLTATYSDGSTHDVTLDNDGHGTPSFFGCSTGSGNCNSQFGTGTLRNQLVVVSSEHGKSVTITGKFSDLTFTPPNTYIVTPGFKTTASLTMKLP